MFTTYVADITFRFQSNMFSMHWPSFDQQPKQPKSSHSQIKEICMYLKRGDFFHLHYVP